MFRELEKRSVSDPVYHNVITCPVSTKRSWGDLVRNSVALKNSDLDTSKVRVSPDLDKANSFPTGPN